MMRIADLREGMKKVDVEGTITTVSAVRSVSLRTGGTAEVADAELLDVQGMGTVKLSLWGAQIQECKKGSRVRITNGYVTSFKNERQLNVGRYGTLHVEPEIL